MIEIRKLDRLIPDELRRLVTGYVSTARYAVRQTETGQQWMLTLERVPLAQPYRKRYDPLEAATLEDYRQVVSLGFSFGAYKDAHCVGVALAEPLLWNKSLCVRELHTAETRRRRGIGRQLVDALAEKARAAGLRILVCETQTTNVPAICFYREMGFQLEGIDLSYYSNNDFPDGEIAVFMKKRLGA
jgi:GNAT superfamily N-acetyltransferase